MGNLEKVNKEYASRYAFMMNECYKMRFVSLMTLVIVTRISNSRS